MIQKTSFKTKDYCKVKFTISQEDAATVELLGLNGDWETPVTLSKKKDGTFSVEVSLPKDTQHEFKYRINGTDWVNDPEEDGRKPDGFGEHNSIVTV